MGHVQANLRPRRGDVIRAKAGIERVLPYEPAPFGGPGQTGAAATLRGLVYWGLGFDLVLGRPGDVRGRVRIVGVIQRTEPRRCAPALLLRLIQPRTAGTLLVHLLPLYLSSGGFHTLDRCRHKLSLES